MTASEAAKAASVIMLLLPDEKQAKIYRESIAPYLTKGDYLAFAHGFNIHFGQIAPPEDVNVIMIAPKGPGHTVRSQFQEGKGVPSLIAVHQDPSGNSKEIALAYAKGLGAGRAGIFETSFKETKRTLRETERYFAGNHSAMKQALIRWSKQGISPRWRTECVTR